MAGRSMQMRRCFDALVYVTAKRKKTLAQGQLVPVEIVGHRDYDLIAALSVIPDNLVAIDLV